MATEPLLTPIAALSTDSPVSLPSGLITEPVPAVPAPLVDARLEPTPRAERISSVDVLRGIALLGIALMNIVFSGLPMSADFNPKIAGGYTGLNLLSYCLQFALFDGKMRGLFSMMFGASAYYLITRGENRGAGIQAAEIYYRRILWLMLFGIVHAYLIWAGDILYPYALMGLVLFPLLRLRPRTLLIAAGCFVAAMTVGSIIEGFQLQKTHRLMEQANAAIAAHKTPTEEQKKAKDDWDEHRKFFNPSSQDLKKEIDQYRGSYFHLVAERAGLVKKFHSGPFYLTGWDMLTMMLVGIAFAKSAVLSAQRSFIFYRRMMLIAFAIGLPMSVSMVLLSWKQGFEPLQTVFTFSTYQIARVAMTLGYMSLFLLICKAGLFSGLQSRLSAVGQTAFSNYILHSLIYGFVFYGYGLALFNRLQRYQLYFVVLGMWIISLVVSPIWLRHFRFGPLEWAWRSLTYWRRQPMRMVPAVPVE
jgi:uncharacterized protein